MGKNFEDGITWGKTEAVFTSREDEITVKHLGEAEDMISWLRRKKFRAEAFGIASPPQLFVFIDNTHKKFTLGCPSGEDPEDLARRINRWLELAREDEDARD